MAVLELKNVKKVYKMPGGGTFQALKGISASFEEGELVSIVGESGSGKSTLMNLIGGLDSDFEGEIIYQGKNLRDYTKQELDRFHKKSIGFIFQNFNLISHLSLLDNVSLAMTLSNVDKETRDKRAAELLTQVGLGEHMHKKPDAISGGQKQRVAIARALINDPDVIIADEPTGALDAETTDTVLEMIKEIAESGKLVLMVTHSDRVASHCTRVLRIDSGSLISDTTQDVEFHKKPADKKETSPVKNMSLTNAIRLAFLNMKAKFGRNALVAFGSSIGIMAVVLMLGIGRGVTNYIKSTMVTYTNPNVTEVHKQSLEMDKKQQEKVQAGDSRTIGSVREDHISMMTGTSNKNTFSQKDIDKLKKIKNVDTIQRGYSTFSLGTNKVAFNSNTANIMMLMTMSKSVTKSSITKGHAPKKNEVLLDQATADLLGKNIVGKKVRLSLTIGDKTIEKEVKVSGIYDTQTSTIVVRYGDLNQVFKDNGQKLKANTVFLYTKNSDNTKAIKDKVKKLGYSGSMQETMTDMFTQMLDVITYVLAAIAGVSLVVSAIMILVVLNISVVERTKEIGVLKALGARRKDVRRIFVSEAFLIGLGSGLLGVVITEILGFAINSVTKPAYDVNVVSLEPQFLISGIIISIVISMLAGLLPANRASKLDPVESLRKE